MPCGKGRRFAAGKELGPYREKLLVFTAFAGDYRHSDLNWFMLESGRIRAPSTIVWRISWPPEKLYYSVPKKEVFQIWAEAKKAEELRLEKERESKRQEKQSRNDAVKSADSNDDSQDVLH
ncbi:hypothetical protein D0Z07_8458 [Hyphodiscus hymeniophilus]|uniref:Uncharacterized protein n=1 Tax=Hyphodiscus hymeniophilus TaxID=353542 RepID=A0A9P6VCD3_9HELO|nr:hypothetical protein D0Z07_8458 [Hyphodiscus hymeniophilus]